MTNQPTPDAGGPYSKNVMRALAAASGILAVIVLVWGVLRMAGGDSRGTTMAAIGAVLILVLAVGIPYGMRRGRM
ncbi:hypothetical protein [Micromonospora sp. WMMD737]|uniref:hypothetical protein n=1 Tax=Micromonospora sp. WMMD737 TaxID=3404113 RepID=UPI003B9477C3